MTKLDLRSLREEANLTQRVVAQRAGLASQSTVSQWELKGDLPVSDLAKFVKAIGGELTICVKLNGKVFEQTLTEN